jgi:hypothetical protein
MFVEKGRVLAKDAKGAKPAKKRYVC